MLDKFYTNQLRRLLAEQRIDREMSVLVLCGTQLDAAVFDTLEFCNVTVSNLDNRHEGTWDTGAAWIRENAESLSCEDEAYDFVAVHLGLHHCRHPHKALCEMYRVAKVGVLVIEPCENFMVKVGRLLGVGQNHEVHAVAANGLISGGVNNTSIPNYVYRWTVPDFFQTISAYAPEYVHSILAKYDLVVHWHDLRTKKRKGRYVLMLLLCPMLKILSWILPRFGNNLAVYIPKPSDLQLHVWLKKEADKVIVNKSWFETEISAGKD